jgi:spore germination cell wall hydrolase CwlJ-like protein
MEPSMSIVWAVMAVFSPVLLNLGMVEDDNIDREEIYCAAQNIYFESRGEPDIGQVAVGQVVMNRVRSNRWPNTICGVVWQEKQFSWTHDGKSDRISLLNSINRESWIKSVYYAVTALHENDITNGATHYHSINVTPYWARYMEVTAMIGNHIFYRER